MMVGNGKILILTTTMSLGIEGMSNAVKQSNQLVLQARNNSTVSIESTLRELTFLGEKMNKFV